jgi:hypothetical protein
MLLREIFDQPLIEKQVWARSGKKTVRKYRCGSGKRKGRVVSKMSQCFASPNMKKSYTLKKTKAKIGGKMSRKSRRTKRINPTSNRVRRLNKSARKR